jgi:hypothetical protein
MMPLIFQQRITPDDLTKHPENIFMFGDNELRRGKGDRLVFVVATQTHSALQRSAHPSAPMTPIGPPTTLIASSPSSHTISRPQSRTF